MSTITLNRENFTRGVRAVVHCVGDKNRPDPQQCLLLSIKPHHVEIVCTNGHMLARWTERLVAGETVERQLLIANHKVLLAYLKDAKGDTVAIDTDTGQIEAIASAAVFNADLCGESYPAYETILDVVERGAQDQAALVKRLREHAKQFDAADLPAYASAARDAAKALSLRSVHVGTSYATVTDKCFRSAKLDGHAEWTSDLDPIVSRSHHDDSLLVVTMPVRQ